MPIQDPPNPWAVLVDYSKTVITLASALLALSVTFADKLLHAGTQPATPLVIAWIALIVTVLSGILAAAWTIHFLRKGTKEKRAILVANVSVFMLLVSGICLVVTGSIGLSPAPAPATTASALDSALSIVQKANGPSHSQFRAVSLKDDSSQANLEVLVSEVGAKSHFRVLVARSSGKVAEYKEIQGPPP